MSALDGTTLKANTHIRHPVLRPSDLTEAALNDPMKHTYNLHHAEYTKELRRENIFFPEKDYTVDVTFNLSDTLTGSSTQR